MIARFEVWDNRECVSRHSAAVDAHRSIVNSRYTSPDSGRLLTLIDPEGRIVAIYVDGREQIDGIDGSAFPASKRVA